MRIVYTAFIAMGFAFLIVTAFMQDRTIGNLIETDQIQNEVIYTLTETVDRQTSVLVQHETSIQNLYAAIRRMQVRYTNIKSWALEYKGPEAQNMVGDE